MNIKEIWLANLKGERKMTREAVANMTDGDLQFKPTEGQMTFGEQALHLISAQKTLVDAFQGKDWVWDQGYTLANFPTLDAVLKVFDEVTAFEVAFYEELQPEQYDRMIQTPWGTPEPMVKLMYSFLTHEAHHRGQMVTYLRLKGMQPPAY
ncbi:MAG TPA: DinB family protein [Symbiobacteriaceae bacterium]|nr:DinB family protein [Symbiobacteriaceae bacterium]